MSQLNTLHQRSYYELLGVDRKATLQQVDAAFCALARHCHPDVRPDDPHAVEAFKRINEAHEVLSDPLRRRAYDEALDRQTRLSKVRGDVRRGPVVRSAAAVVSGMHQAADVSIELLLTPDEARRGGPCKFSVPGRGPRKVQVNLPRRLAAGSVVCVVGAGRVDARTGLRGNLYLHIRIWTGWDKPR